MKLSELADAIDAQLRVVDAADADREVSACEPLETAGADGVAFLANPKYIAQARQTNAAAIIAATDTDIEGKPLLLADDPYYAFRNAVVVLHGFRKHASCSDEAISPQAVVHPTASIGAGTIVHPFAVISERVTIGENCILYPHTFIGPDAILGDDCQIYPQVSVYDRCVIGNRVTLHAGTVIGQDGFGYATHAGAHHKIPQAGNVIIEDDVEMGANCSVDRATIGSTIIGTGTKFSNSVVIGHGTKVGKHNLHVALVGVAGSVELGDYVSLGGQVGIAGHLKIGNLVQIAATSGVMTNIPDKEIWGGTPATPMNNQKRSLLYTAKLPELVSRLKALEKQVKKLKS